MEKPEFKCGFVILVGRPNSGKSSILNALLGQKVSIVSRVPQTTRHQIRGILDLKGAQAVFVDTPGMHSFKDELTVCLNNVAAGALQDCELILYAADSSRAVGPEEEKVMDSILRRPAKTIMALNKIDLGGRFTDDYVAAWKAKIAAKSIPDPVISFLPLSAKTGKNLDVLRGLIAENLPVGPAFYEPGTVTDFPVKMRCADIIREKLFCVLRDELPHSIAVEIEEIAKRKKLTYIKAAIYVERDSQKKIVIGKNAAILKQAGIEARRDLEIVLGTKVYLDLGVKVEPGWQKSPRILQNLGYLDSV